jgi:hypothetical protein
MADPVGPTPFESELLARFPGAVTTPGAEVWVRYEDAVAAIDLAQERGLGLLGMDGFFVGESVYVSMSRIADFSLRDYQGSAYDDAKALLIGPWAQVPDDLHEDASGRYMIDIVVDD